MRRIQPTYGSICRLTTTVNILQWSHKKEPGQPVVAAVPLLVVATANTSGIIQISDIPYAHITSLEEHNSKSSTNCLSVLCLHCAYSWNDSFIN